MILIYPLIVSIWLVSPTVMVERKGIECAYWLNNKQQFSATRPYIERCIKKQQPERRWF